MARTRMAGDVFQKEKRSKGSNKGQGPLTNAEKFKSEKGYDKNLSNDGFRDEFLEDMYKDKQIDYYGDHRHYHKMIARTGRKTGLNFNRVNNPQEAEISNFDRNDPGVIYRGKGTNKENPEAMIGQQLSGFGTGYEQEDAIATGGRGSIAGQSSAFDNRPFGFDDMAQINRADPNLAKKEKRQTRWHELGHSLGLRGDDSITNPNDPSTMSYNPGRNNRLKKRDFRSIKKNFSPYM